MEHYTATELEVLLGENIKNLRLQRNIGQIDLAPTARKTLRHLAGVPRLIYLILSIPKFWITGGFITH